MAKDPTNLSGVQGWAWRRRDVVAIVHRIHGPGRPVNARRHVVVQCEYVRDRQRRRGPFMVVWYGDVPRLVVEGNEGNLTVHEIRDECVVDVAFALDVDKLPGDDDAAVVVTLVTHVVAWMTQVVHAAVARHPACDATALAAVSTIAHDVEVYMPPNRRGAHVVWPRLRTNQGAKGWGPLVRAVARAVKQTMGYAYVDPSACGSLRMVGSNHATKPNHAYRPVYRGTTTAEGHFDVVVPSSWSPPWTGLTTAPPPPGPWLLTSTVVEAVERCPLQRVGIEGKPWGGRVVVRGKDFNWDDADRAVRDYVATTVGRTVPVRIEYRSRPDPMWIVENKDVPSAFWGPGYACPVANKVHDSNRAWFRFDRDPDEGVTLRMVCLDPVCQENKAKRVRNAKLKGHVYREPVDGTFRTWFHRWLAAHGRPYQRRR